MIGDQSLFTSPGGIERLWEISGPLLQNPPPAEPYETRIVGPAVGRQADRAVPAAPAGALGPPVRPGASGPAPDAGPVPAVKGHR